MSEMRVVPDSEQVEAFARDGVTVLGNVVTSDQLAALVDAVEYNIANPSAWATDYTTVGHNGRFFGDYVSWERIPGFRQIALYSALPAVASALMNSATVRFFHDHVLVKEPDTVEVTPWHHDQPYYCVDGDQNVSFWISLDAVPAKAGLHFVAGSHRWGQQFIPRKFIDSSGYVGAEEAGAAFYPVPDIDAHGNDYEILRFDVRPGDVIAFHYRTLHSAPGTVGLTTGRRRAVSMRYIGDDATFTRRPWTTSPPFDQRDLVEGGPLDDPRFPFVG